MRKWILLAVLTAGISAAGAFNAHRAEAMTIGIPAGLGIAAGGVSITEEAAYVCRRVWRCGPYGCGWRRHCFWSGPRYYGRRHWAPRRHWGPRRHWR